MKTSDFLNPRHCICAAINGTVQQMAHIRHASPCKLVMNSVVTRPITLTFSEKLLRSLRLNPVLALPTLPPNLNIMPLGPVGFPCWDAQGKCVCRHQLRVRKGREALKSDRSGFELRLGLEIFLFF